MAELSARGVAPDAITVMPVPGAFELPLAAMALAKTRRFACIVALGCVIRGDTPHFDYVASEAASGLQLAAIETGVPVAFGVLTLDRADQADARVDKGAEAVRTALEMADLFANLRAAAARYVLRFGAARTATIRRRMARVCVICGKKPSVGNNRSHSMVATKRRFNPQPAEGPSCSSTGSRHAATSARAASRPARSSRPSDRVPAAGRDQIERGDFRASPGDVV